MAFPSALFGSDAKASASKGTGPLLDHDSEAGAAAEAADDEDDFVLDVVLFWRSWVHVRPLPTSTVPFPARMGLPLPLSCNRLNGRLPGDAGIVFSWEADPHRSVGVSGLLDIMCFVCGA